MFGHVLHTVASNNSVYKRTFPNSLTCTLTLWCCIFDTPSHETSLKDLSLQFLLKTPCIKKCGLHQKKFFNEM